MEVGRPRAWAGEGALRDTERLDRDPNGPARGLARRDLAKARVQARCIVMLSCRRTGALHRDR
jgi:hypothetical protein